jgi:hypothetical protein
MYLFSWSHDNHTLKMSIRLLNDTDIPLEHAEIGMFVAEGGTILSLHPFATEHGRCILDGESMELHKTGAQFVAVYLENVHSVSSYSAFFVYSGNRLAEIREELLDRLAWDGEHVPTIEFYLSRSGATKRQLCGPILSKHVDSVYVYMR